MGWLRFAISDRCVLYTVRGGWGHREGHGGPGPREEAYDILDMDIMSWESLWIDDSPFYLLPTHSTAKPGFHTFLLFGTSTFCAATTPRAAAEGRMASALFWRSKRRTHAERTDHSAPYPPANPPPAGKRGKPWSFLHKKKKKDAPPPTAVYRTDLPAAHGPIFSNTLFASSYIHSPAPPARRTFASHSAVDFSAPHAYPARTPWAAGWDSTDSFDLAEPEDDDAVHVRLGDFRSRAKLTCQSVLSLGKKTVARRLRKGSRAEGMQSEVWTTVSFWLLRCSHRSLRSCSSTETSSAHRIVCAFATYRYRIVTRRVVSGFPCVCVLPCVPTAFMRPDASPVLGRSVLKCSADFPSLTLQKSLTCPPHRPSPPARDYAMLRLPKSIPLAMPAMPLHASTLATTTTTLAPQLHLPPPTFASPPCPPLHLRLYLLTTAKPLSKSILPIHQRPLV